MQRGEILYAPVTGQGTRSVAGGLIHDWLGAAFIPNATLEGLLTVVHDYGRYKEIYKPVVADSKVLGCSETGQKFSMVWQHRILLVSAAIEGQYQARDFAVDARRGYNIARTIEVGRLKATGGPASIFCSRAREAASSGNYTASPDMRSAMEEYTSNLKPSP